MEYKNIKKVIALSSVAVAVLSFSGCTSRTDKIMQSMDEMNYQEALRIYNSWEMDTEERTGFVEAMRTELTEAVDKYANNTITYEDATAIVNTIHEMFLQELSQDEASAYAEIEALKKSKEMFDTGEEALEAKDYLKAIRSFECVISTDCNYESAEEKLAEAEDAYVEDVLAEAQTLIDQNAYDAALELLEKSSEEMPGIDAISEKITELQVNYVLDMAETSAKSGDYEDALAILGEFDSTGAGTEVKENIAKAYDTYSKEYVSMILQKVEQLRSNKNYIQAIQMLENAYGVVPSSEFTAMIEVINNEKPMYLCEVKCQNQNKYELHTTGDPITDTLGNSYQVGNLHVISTTDGGWSEDDKGYAEYYVGYKYNKLTGVIAPADSSDNINCSISIQGDGVSLLTLDINRLTEPYAFEIDISAVNYLKICSGDVGDSGTFTTILYDFTLSK